MKKLLSALLFFFLFSFSYAQLGLEDVIVEIYYVSDANDAADTDGGNLPVGSVTYRIFIDLAEGWKMQSPYGDANHELFFATTTSFFNNIDWGETTGRQIRNNRLNRHTVALDSWITVGSDSDGSWAVLKSDDTNGSIVGGVNNNGGSEGVAGGLLVNDDPLAGIPLTIADGLIPGPGPDVTLIAAPQPWDIFGNENSTSIFSLTNGAWAVLGGTVGPTPANRILVAQITTDGDLSFAMNIAIQELSGGLAENYVSSNPQAGEFFFPGLTYPLVPVLGCLDPAACNFDPMANTDDGSCIVPVANCSLCNATNDGLDLIDADGDGVCDGEEIAGCTNPEAVNYNPEATDDDGSCSFESIPGCINPNACNYDLEATVNDGSCILPVLNCAVCNDNNDGLEIVDTDGDGICDAEEIAGCQSLTACNYNPNATDAGNCLEPVENCQACNGTNDALVIIDTDGDGVCDAEEIFGCTDSLAVNFNPEATEDDGTCILVGLTENEGGMSLSLFPNPSQSELHLELHRTSSFAETVVVTIYSPLAVAVKQFNFGISSGDFVRETLEISGLAAGIYFMEIQLGEYRIIRRFVKE